MVAGNDKTTQSNVTQLLRILCPLNEYTVNALSTLHVQLCEGLVLIMRHPVKIVRGCRQRNTSANLRHETTHLER